VEDRPAMTEVEEAVAVHPLTRIIEKYCDEYEELRDGHLDLAPIHFHRTFGLVVQCPYTWNILDSVKHIIESFSAAHKIIVIFSGTAAYRKIHPALGDGIQYLSWHEIFTGMHVAQTDVRYIQRSKQILGDADLIFFIDPPALPEVVDQVRGHTTGGLVILSGSGTNE
jgi:hypothetical protein